MNRTNRVLPVYSADISGVCSALYELGGMTVMHDASGCNSTYTTHDEPRWYSMDSMVYISALSELEAVMGDDEKLVRDIVDAADNLRPRFICIGGTPIPMMMGTDFKGIARMIERQTGIPAFGISTNGMHSYIAGAGEALNCIARRFCPASGDLASVMERRKEERGQEPQSGLTANILGATPLDFSLTGNISGLKEFLRSHGIRVVSCWAMESSLDEMMMAGEADVNLVVSSAGIKAAETLKKMYGTPYVTGLPVGGRTALRLVRLMEAAACSGEDQILFQQETGPLDVRDYKADLGLMGLPRELSHDKVLIVGEQIIANSIRCSLREDFGAVKAAVICPTEGKTEYAEEGDMLSWDEDEVIRMIGQSTVVIADPLYRQVCPRGHSAVFVDFPHEACSGRMYHEIMVPFVSKV